MEDRNFCSNSSISRAIGALIFSRRKGIRHNNTEEIHAAVAGRFKKMSTSASAPCIRSVFKVFVKLDQTRPNLPPFDPQSES